MKTIINKHIEQALFKDKSTIVLRELLAHSDRKWVVRDLAEICGVSLGLVSRILSFLDRLGFLERIRRGRHGYTKLKKKEALVNTWLSAYDFSLNKTESFYSPDNKITNKIVKFLLKKELNNTYALTLHTGANLLTSHVLSDNVYIYLKKEAFEKHISEMCDRIVIKKLIEGGNLHFIMPYYKKSVFYRSRTLNGYRVVSNLQLYLDLYNFTPRGKQHAKYLKSLLSPGGIYT